MIFTVTHLVTVEEVEYMTIKVHHLRPAPGAKTAKTRVGRGEGSKGKTAGRGTKGTKARKNISAAFEGGQMPIHMRLPKLKGFKNRSRSSSRSSTWTGSPSCSRNGGAGRPARAGRGRRGPQGPAGQGPRHRRPRRRDAPGHGARVQRVRQGEDRRRRWLRHRAVRRTTTAPVSCGIWPGAWSARSRVRPVTSDIGVCSRAHLPGAAIGLLESASQPWICVALARAPTPTRQGPPAAASRRRKKLLSAFLSAFRTPDLRKKLLFTLGIIALYRLGATLPSPGVSYGNVQKCLDAIAGSDNGRLHAAQPVLRRRAAAAVGLRAGHHALHHRAASSCSC